MKGLSVKIELNFFSASLIRWIFFSQLNKEPHLSALFTYLLRKTCNKRGCKVIIIIFQIARTSQIKSTNPNLTFQNPSNKPEKCRD